MKKRLFTLLLMLIASFCLLLGLSACSDDDIDGTYYQYKNGQIDKSLWIKLDDGEWTDDDNTSGTYKVDGDTITFYVELFGEKEELCTATISGNKLTMTILGMQSVYYKDGKMPVTFGSSSGASSSTVKTYSVTYDAQGGEFTTGYATFTQSDIDLNETLIAPISPTKTGYAFAGWAKDKKGNTMWDFSADKVTGNTTLYAIWRQKSGTLLSVDGASIKGTNVLMVVDEEVDSVSLANKVVCSDDSTWRLYADKLGQTEIPTKIATSSLGELKSGDNEFYIVVTSQDATQVNVYTLTIHRSYEITIHYMSGDTLLYTDTAYTGERYAATYTPPSMTGYTYVWYTATGNKYQTQVLWESLVLYADITVNTYTITYDENGGDELSVDTAIVTYGSSYTLATPTRTGYTFRGWYYNSTALTDEYGVSLSVWKYTQDITVKAKWVYTATVESYVRVDVNGNADADGEYIYFGQYPQTKITNTALISTLNTAAGTLPTNGNNQAWTSYGYYISGSNTTDYMWYIDLDTDADGQDDYRGVYFTSYRPYYTTSGSSTSYTYQVDNGYTISEVYWFSYDPILWKIMKEESGNATILCEMIIDSQQYDYDGSYSFNYAESTIRAWLNDEFYNTAFNTLQKSIIVNVEVDNSAETTASSSNQYECENTNDNVWLLSLQEAQAITGDYYSTTEREKYTTDYAQSQGADTNAGRGYWWLRSPYYYYSSYAGYACYAGFVYYDGYVDNDVYGVDSTSLGVVPALQIRLS